MCWLLYLYREEKNMNQGKNKFCLNCHSSITELDFYCKKCGQKNKSSIFSIRKLVVDTFLDVFNLDAKIWKTLKDIWIPARLSLAFVAGKRASYMNPGRLLVITALLYFAIVVYGINKSIDNNDLKSNDLYSYVAEQELEEKFDSLSNQFNILSTADMDSLKKRLFTTKHDESNQYLIPKDQVTMFGMINNYPILKKDVVQLTQDEIFEKHQIKDFWNKAFYGQLIKVYKDRAGAIKFVIGNMAWAFIVSIIFMAVFLKLFYIRHKMFYVEHVVFLMHFYSFVFLCFIIFGGFNFTNDDSSQLGIAGPSMAITAIYFFIALKRYYQQGIIKTVIKASLILMAFIFVMSFIVMIISAISLLLF